MDQIESILSLLDSQSFIVLEVNGPFGCQTEPLILFLWKEIDTKTSAGP